MNITKRTQRRTPTRLRIGLISVLLFIAEGLIAAVTLALAAAAVCLFAGVNLALLFPELAYWCGAVLALALSALAVFTATGCLYFVSSVRSFRRVGTLTALRPKFSRETDRKLRSAALYSDLVFALCVTAAFAAAAMSAGGILQ